ncbi:nucleotide exchange factor GrpE [Sulfurospirillum barnesii]|uniref:Protein GrpE n=1 Tax=Sulfurospirillum barnesii (strain ATCC 700032 / DSM 10660 / SES-3) TaxID=760154 RepID=I3XXN5_SULBS|nr:nucleotide exchange factor GrpE [Sulfurospirillum barnesii]AFL68709.1 molecular chaperone GrpE (heat shock protein) [Sulfurospirillum barnesii SES-3]
MDETLKEEQGITDISAEIVPECCKDVDAEVGEQKSEVEELREKIVELEDKYLRANADFDNMKRRLEKEKMQAISYAHEVFARDLLPVIDALEMAILAGSNQEVDSGELLAKVKEGLELTIEQFRKAFEKHGVELVESEGGFDPNFHEAVMQLESEEKNSGEILQVFQKGYKIKERILRPAMVSIVK